MIDRQIGQSCTGCSACSGRCPTAAISMKEDAEGFLVPSVDNELCVECGLCVRVCPVLGDRRANESEKPVVYAGWNLDEEVRCSSSSGGIFPALANAVLAQGGEVAGAAYDQELSVRHVLIRSGEEISVLGQSKYTQSNPEGVFGQIGELLACGKKVLFCGTPCQVAGLKRYLGCDNENLFTCDFICHGVISPKVYRKYLNDIGKIHKSKPVSIQFKNKDYGWNRFSTKIEMENGNVHQMDRTEDWYTMGYTKHHLYVRSSCHECLFRTIPRVSDITLGDFWGIGKLKAELDDDRGTSAILVNSAKGAQMLDWIRDQLYLEERSFEDVLAGNVSLIQSPERGEFREYFFEHMDRMRFDKLIMKIEEKSWHLTPKEKVLRELHLLKVKLKDWIK